MGEGVGEPGQGGSHVRHGVRCQAQRHCVCEGQGVAGQGTIGSVSGSGNCRMHANGDRHLRHQLTGHRHDRRQRLDEVHDVRVRRLPVVHDRAEILAIRRREHELTNGDDTQPVPVSSKSLPAKRAGSALPPVNSTSSGPPVGETSNLH